MMSHKLVASLAACCALVGLAACGSSDNSSTSTAADTGASTSAAAPESSAAKDALIQVINPLPNVFVDANNDGAKRAAKRLGLTNVQFTQSDGDAAKEVANINNAVTKGAKAIIINPVSSVGITPAIEAANAKGVCTIIAYSNIGETANDDVPEGSKAFIGWNELEGGQAVGDALATSMDGKGGVVIIQGLGSDRASQQREKGARQVWEEKYPGIKVLGVQPAEFDPAKARTVMQNFIQRYGDQITGVLAIGDQMGAAAADAVDQSSLKGKVQIGGFGAEKDFVDRIKEGKATATVPFVPIDDYDKAVELAAQCIDGDKDPVRVKTPDLPIVAKLQSTGYVVTKDNVDQWVPQW
jgi:ABC-type sugar transport system substrate-binding protein